MPRTARKKSKSGIYHIVLRGINRQTIFEDDEDAEKFLQTLKEYKRKSIPRGRFFWLNTLIVYDTINDGSDFNDKKSKRKK